MIEPTEEFPATPGLYWWRYKRSRLWVQLTIVADDAGALWVRESTGGELPLANWTDGIWYAGEEPPMDLRDGETVGKLP
jgi:hypothetical protein